MTLLRNLFYHSLSIIQGVPKVCSSNFMHYNFWSKLYFYFSNSNSDLDLTSIMRRNVIFISFTTNKKQTIAYWARLLITYFSEIIPLILTLVWEVMSKTCASCFIRGSRHLKTIKALGLRPHAFICFWVSGTPDETIRTCFWHITWNF